MKHKHSKQPDKLSLTARALFGFLGLLITADGALTIASHRLHYPSWWGGPVFGPFAVCIGLLAVVIAIRGGPFKGKRLQK